MKKTTSYTLTLILDNADQRVIEQLLRESKGMIPTPEAVVYQKALEGLRDQLEAKREENRKKRADQLAGKADQEATSSSGNGAKAKKTEASAL